MKIYLSNAIIQNKNAMINFNVSFAGVELYIPKEWNVVNNLDCSLGGVSEKNSNMGAGVNTLTLTGNLTCAGITIIYS